MRGGAGSFDRAQRPRPATAGAAGGAAYRVYSQWTQRGDTHQRAAPPDDDWSMFTNGVRADWARGADDWMLDGGVRGSARPDRLDAALRGRARSRAAHRRRLVIPQRPRPRPLDAPLRQRRVAPGADLGRTSCAGPISSARTRTPSTPTRSITRLWARGTTWSPAAAIASSTSTTGQNFAVAFDAARCADLRRRTCSSQDEIALPRRLQLTLGTKLEHESRSGREPAADRAADVGAGTRHHVWIAASQALRTPSLIDLRLRVNAAVLQGDGLPIVDRPARQSGLPAGSVLRDVEGGYRVELRAGASVDVTAFRGRYTGLPTYEPLAPVFEAIARAAAPLRRRSPGESACAPTPPGIEIAAHAMPAAGWRIDGSYSAFHLTPHPDAGSADAAAAVFDGNAPARQWLVRSSVVARIRAAKSA